MLVRRFKLPCVCIAQVLQIVYGILWRRTKLSTRIQLNTNDRDFPLQFFLVLILVVRFDLCEILCIATLSYLYSNNNTLMALWDLDILFILLDHFVSYLIYLKI